ncbi:glutamate--cysteine ligase [Gammaproteobacteria bacterium]|nr:glutamate--cysteine ligase [Gammaproteobacteria bacterium]
MFDSNSDLVNLLKLFDADTLRNSLSGIERELLRVDQECNLHFTSHPKSLGSALFNKYITTDFSEAQLELVTPTFSDNKALLSFLKNIHHFVQVNVNHEILWPYSMPPFITDEDTIRIASYGSSNLAKFKSIYREGLSNRYGRLMQTISGIHYNFSITEDLISIINQNQKVTEEFSRSSLYFNCIRNLHKLSWLILYFFGASPVVSENFISNKYKFKKIYGDIYYIPFSTSLRMSDIGYQNTSRISHNISLNSENSYIDSLKMLTEKPSADFSKIPLIEDGRWLQLNKNILQIEDEYYSVARPKSNLISNDRLTKKLTKSGTQYVELRSVDINPFSLKGIDIESIYFLETFMLYCLLIESPQMNKIDYDQTTFNHLLVSIEGRKPNLMLSRNNKNISLRDWAIEILDGMLILAEKIDDDEKNYTEAVLNAMSKIKDTDALLSSLLLDEISKEKLSYSDFWKSISQKHKRAFLDRSKSENLDWNTLQKESDESELRQRIADNESDVLFEDYLADYFD